MSFLCMIPMSLTANNITGFTNGDLPFIRWVGGYSIVWASLIVFVAGPFVAGLVTPKRTTTSDTANKSVAST